MIEPHLVNLNEYITFNDKLFYLKIHVLEDVDSMACVSNNKRKLYEWLYNWMEFEEENNNIYYFSGEISQCDIINKETMLRCIESHDSEEFGIYPVD